jgi:hypothetical protein
MTNHRAHFKKVKIFFGAQYCKNAKLENDTFVCWIVIVRRS